MHAEAIIDEENATIASIDLSIARIRARLYAMQRELTYAQKARSEAVARRDKACAAIRAADALRNAAGGAE